MNKSQLNKIVLFAKPYYKKADKYHGWDHIVAVRRNALILTRGYKSVNLGVLEAGCYLHDIGRSKKDKGHAVESGKLARPYLKKIGVCRKERDEIVHAVVSHAKEKILKARTLEAKLLFDADKLEILSVFGFLRVWAWLADERDMELNKAMEFLWKWILSIRKKYLQTNSAKKIADGEMKLISRIVENFKTWGRN